MVTFEGTADDVDVANETLTVAWESDQDGIFGASAPDVNGTIAFDYDGLTLNTHLITMTVSDERGETCADTVTLEIGTPPEVTIDTPADGSLLNDDIAASFSATVSDQKDAADALTVRWESDVDGVLFEGFASSGLTAVLDVDTLSLGNHTIALFVTDTDGLQNSASIAITMNGLPSAPVIDIDPSAPLTTDTLAVTLVTPSVDPESETVTYTYEWSIDGVVSTTHTSDTIDPADTAQDHLLRFVVTPADPPSASTSATASVTIGNSTPSLTAVDITPDTGVTTSTELTCAYTANDADGDTLTPTFAWTSSAGTALGTSATLTLDPADIAPTDTVTCVVTIEDTDGATATLSDSVTVDNTAPEVTSVTITPSTGVTTATTLTCAAVVSDDDGETPSLAYTWTDTSGTTLGSTDSLNLTQLTKPNETITCSVTATDAYSGTDSDSASVSVENTNPTIDSISVTPNSGVTTSERLTCTATASDADGGSPTITYAWTNGTGTSLGTGSILDLTPTTVVPGDTVQCEATATDVDSGTAKSTASVSVVNTDPVVNSVLITPNSGVTTSTSLTCAATATDADGGSPSLDYAWSTTGGVALGTGTTVTLSATLVQPTDSVLCTVTAKDTDGGEDTLSDSITVDNTPPVITTHQITPATGIKTDTTLTASLPPRMPMEKPQR